MSPRFAVVLGLIAAAILFRPIRALPGKVLLRVSGTVVRVERSR